MASGLVSDLFGELAQFAGEFTSRKEASTKTVFEQYADLQRDSDEIKVHDSSWPRSLSENRYPSIDMSEADNLFWLDKLTRHIAVGVGLDKFLGAVFPKVHGGPFSNE